jgi:hypothetical protein
MKDPLTGDELNRLEYYVRQIQVVVRTPWFILAFNTITVACIIAGQLFNWNVFASWLAIIIEWLVGTYMFGQTGRDAILIRTIKKELDQIRDEIRKHNNERS